MPGGAGNRIRTCFIPPPPLPPAHTTLFTLMTNDREREEEGIIPVTTRKINKPHAQNNASEIIVRHRNESGCIVTMAL